MGAWDRMTKIIQDQLPPFNEYLLKEFKREKLDECAVRCDIVIKQMMNYFPKEAGITYVGYKELSPDERIAYIQDNPIMGFSIRQTDIRMMQYEMCYLRNLYKIRIPIAYLNQGRIRYNGTNCYPIFPIVEKAGINRLGDGSVIIKIIKVPITFCRRDTIRIVSTSHTAYWEMLVTSKIHMGGGKKADRLPLILYHLCKWGYDVTMQRYGINPRHIQVVAEAGEPTEDVEYFRLRNGKYLQCHRSALDLAPQLRVVLSLIKIFAENPNFDETNYTNVNYYKATLGRFIVVGGGDKSNILMKLRADRHLEMTDPLLDQVAIESMASIGVHVTNIYDFLLWVYNSIDDLLVTYDPTNYNEKKFGTIDQILAFAIREINKKQYQLINSKKGIDERELAKFARSASRQDNYLGKSSIIVPFGQVYGDNHLITIGGKRVLSMESLETDSRKKGKARSVSIDLLKAHPSHISTVSVLDIPGSNPGVAGTINPFVQTDHDGNIIPSQFYVEIEHLYQ